MAGLEGRLRERRGQRAAEGDLVEGEPEREAWGGGASEGGAGEAGAGAGDGAAGAGDGGASEAETWDH